MTTEEIRAAVLAAATRAGLIDPDLINSPFLADAVNGVKVENYVLVGIPEALDAMRIAKPNWFVPKDWSKATDAEVEEFEATLRTERDAPPEYRPFSHRSLPVASLTEDEYVALGRDLGGSADGYDRSLLASAHQRLGLQPNGEQS
jgi:hypothetical protein